MACIMGSDSQIVSEGDDLTLIEGREGLLCLGETRFAAVHFCHSVSPCCMVHGIMCMMHAGDELVQYVLLELPGDAYKAALTPGSQLSLQVAC